MHANPLERERGPENGHPDHLPTHMLAERLDNDNSKPKKEQLIQQRKQGVIHHRLIRQPVCQTSKRRRGAPGTYSVACVVAQVAR